MKLNEVADSLLTEIDVGYTFLLLLTRFSGLIMMLPGIGGGERGIYVRFPAVILMAVAALFSSAHASLPSDWGGIVVGFMMELAFGMMLGFFPRLLIAGVQTASQLASTTMGLNASNLIDPSTGSTSSDLGRIYGDVATILFLALGGHYTLISVASGFGGMVPGTFRINASVIDVLVDATAHTFTVGVMLSAPVITALLLTQFVMGLVTKAVPSVNIFIVSFPLTIGIGLIVSMLALPDAVVFMEKEFGALDATVAKLLESQQGGGT